VRFLKNFFAVSPAVARVAPFVIFLALTFCQGKFGASSAYWFYFAKTIIGAWLIWEMRLFVPEMRWAISWEAVAVGILVFAIWVGLDPFYWHLTKNGTAWNPNLQFGENTPLTWLFILTRIVGSTFVVPPLEEAFYRSFLYRYFASQNFLAVPLNKFLPLPFFATAIIFGFSHNEWLAGILCGAAFQWLVIRKNRLGDAMSAHAITNFLLGIWIVRRGEWHFW
jgi:CAAX prenyl protease-like protein